MFLEDAYKSPDDPFITFAHWDADTKPAEWLFLVRQPTGRWELMFQTTWEECISEAEECAEMSGHEYRIVCLLDDPSGT